VDSSTAGPNFQADAVASLAPMLVETTRSLQDPSGKSLYEAWKQYAIRKRELAHESGEVRDSMLADTRIGSGSDHTVFLNFVGMPVIGLSFGGPYGVYHSMFDDFFWMNHFGDPGYRYHTLMSQLWGVVALRLANADLLPYDFSNYGDNIRDFVHDLAAGEKLNQFEVQPLVARINWFAGAGNPGGQALTRTLTQKALMGLQTQMRYSGRMPVDG